METRTIAQSDAPAAADAATGSGARPSRVLGYLWLILKNVIGWVLILGSGPVGLAVPGPGGIPLFLIGFALISFPGKRRLTARVLKGKPIDPSRPNYRRAIAITALIFPAAVLAYCFGKLHLPQHLTRYWSEVFGVTYFFGAALLWFLGGPAVYLINRILRLVPRIRRRVRPWLRRHGIELLPPRRRRRRIQADGPLVRDPDEEILDISQQHKDRARNAWSSVKPWLRRALGLALTAAVFFLIFKPIVKNWEQVKDRIAQLHWGTVLLAAGMFASFLFVFRAMAWRRILIGFGHRLPVPASTRIWSTSELARYLPGVIWQVVGRVYLIRPYGVRGSVCSTSQILELAIFLLANILLAVSSLVWLGIKHFHGPARAWLFGAMALVPVLSFLLHPRIFYGMADRILARLGKPAVMHRLSFGEMAGLLFWAVLGLVWQSMAIWVIVHEPLGLQFTKWWVVAGAYSLAWCAGFLAFWAPGGLGVRELVFMGAMEIALPGPARQHFSDPKVLLGFLAFLAVLLRLWATAGELILSGMAYAFDYRGALGRADAPGRISPPTHDRPTQSAAVVPQKKGIVATDGAQMHTDEEKAVHGSGE